MGRRIPSSVTMSRALTNESTVDGSLDDDDASEMELMDHQTYPDSAASDGEPALEAFLERFPSDTGEAVTSEDIAAVYDFPLDGFQRERRPPRCSAATASWCPHPRDRARPSWARPPS